MPNIVVNVPAPLGVLLVTILVALGFALVAQLSGETSLDVRSFIPWGGPASELVNYTLYIGAFLFLVSTGLHWALALLAVLVWFALGAYKTKVLHPIVDELLERHKAQKHSTINVTPTAHDQDPPEWV